MIMNILQPDSGNILFNGEPIRAEHFSKIGYLPEERGLYRKVKLLELIVYFGTLKGLPSPDVRQIAKQYLERFDLVDYTNRKVEELSKGNQQKVQFIIAILHNPELIILDEPFSGLDPVNQVLLKDIIKEFNVAGKTVIFSTHQMEQVEKMCHEVCMINRGQRVLYGSLKDIKGNFSVRKFLIKYKGKEALIRQQLGNNFTVTNDSVRGELNSGLEINDVLQKIIRDVTITHVDICEPSLEEIFIGQVNGKKDE